MLLKILPYVFNFGHAVSIQLRIDQPNVLDFNWDLPVPSKNYQKIVPSNDTLIVGLMKGNSVLGFLISKHKRGQQIVTRPARYL